MDWSLTAEVGMKPEVQAGHGGHGWAVPASNELPALPGVTRADWASEAYGVNRYEWVVGRAQDRSLAWRAFVYKPGLGGRLYLHLLLPPRAIGSPPTASGRGVLGRSASRFGRRAGRSLPPCP
jgi:hypothetical protein